MRYDHYKMYTTFGDCCCHLNNNKKYSFNKEVKTFFDSLTPDVSYESFPRRFQCADKRRGYFQIDCREQKFAIQSNDRLMVLG